MISDRPCKILLLEADASAWRVLNAFLCRHRYQVFHATSAAEGLRTFFAARPDLVLLDPLHSDIPDQEFCQRFHRCADIPVYYFREPISAPRHQHLQQQIAELEPRTDAIPTVRQLLNLIPELQACPHAVVKKTACAEEQPAVRIDGTRYQVVHKQGQSKLTVIEYKLLQFLMQNPETVLSVNQILDGVWGKQTPHFVPYVHNYVWRLRQKIESDPRHPQHIVSEYGVGYKFVNG